MKQNCHFDRGLAQYKHASLPMSFLGINTTLLGFPKRCITLVYLKRLKSYQPSKFKRVDFLPLYLVKRTFRLHFYWQLLSPLRYTKVIYLFGKPRSVVIMPEKLKGGVACLFCARPLTANICSQSAVEVQWNDCTPPRTTVIHYMRCSTAIHCR